MVNQFMQLLCVVPWIKVSKSILLLSVVKTIYIVMLKSTVPCHSFQTRSTSEQRHAEYFMSLYDV